MAPPTADRPRILFAVRTLVTGGSGFLGSHLVERLQRGGDEVVVPRSAEYDLRREEDAIRLFEEAQPEVVYHLAALDRYGPTPVHRLSFASVGQGALPGLGASGAVDVEAFVEELDARDDLPDGLGANRSAMGV